MNPETGKFLMLIGAAILAAGAGIYFLHDKLHWIGHLPGDIRIRKGHTQIFIPLTTMILASALLTLLAWIWRRI